MCNDLTPFQLPLPLFPKKNLKSRMFNTVFELSFTNREGLEMICLHFFWEGGKGGEQVQHVK